MKVKSKLTFLKYRSQHPTTLFYLKFKYSESEGFLAINPFYNKIVVTRAIYNKDMRLDSYNTIVYNKDLEWLEEIREINCN